MTIYFRRICALQPFFENNKIVYHGSETAAINFLFPELNMANETATWKIQDCEGHWTLCGNHLPRRTEAKK